MNWGSAKRRQVPVVPGPAVFGNPSEVPDLTQFMVQSDGRGAPCAACGSSTTERHWRMQDSIRLMLCADYRMCIRIFTLHVQ